MSAAQRGPSPLADEPPQTPPGSASGTAADAGRQPLARCLMQVLWPAFLGAAVTVGVMFSIIDPLEIDTVHNRLDGSRELAYTGGFLVLWLLYSLACSLTWLLSTTDRRRDSLQTER